MTIVERPRLPALQARQAQLSRWGRGFKITYAGCHSSSLKFCAVTAVPVAVSLLRVTLGRELSELEPVLHASDVSQSHATTSAAASGTAPKTQDLLLKLEKCKCMWWGWEEVLGVLLREDRESCARAATSSWQCCQLENGTIFQKSSVSIVQR